MIQLQHALGELKLSTLKKFRSLLPKNRKMHEEANALNKARRAKIENILPPNFSWAELYELNIKEMSILAFATMGLLDALVQAAHSGLDLNQFMLEEAIRSTEDENEEVEWSGGHGGLFTQADIYAYTTQTCPRCAAWVSTGII